MHRWLIALSAFVVAAASITAAGVAAPRARAGDAPIGHIGDTLRVDTGTYIADVTVSSVAPCDPPPGAIVRGGVYWDAYRDPVSNVVLLDKKTGQHLAQWNL